MTCDRRLFGQHLPGSREHHAMIAFLSTVTTSLAACVGWKSHEPYAFFLSLFTTLLIRVLSFTGSAAYRKSQTMTQACGWSLRTSIETESLSFPSSMLTVSFVWHI